MASLRAAAEGQDCVRCGTDKGVVLCHYTGARRLSYGGGYGLKVRDIAGAHLCGPCHRHMDILSRNKALKWEHSEEFLHFCMMTILRLAEQGEIKW